MTQRIVLVHHGDEVVEDRVTAFFRQRGTSFDAIRPYLGERLGEVDSSVLGSVVFGGPFNAFEEDRHPFLLDEARWIEHCMKNDIPLLGICQGAQQIAHILGGKVEPGPDNLREFGYYELKATEAGRDYFPERLVVCEAHSYGFDVPAGAALLASSQLFPHQAFKYGVSTFAFLFHAEVTIEGFRHWQGLPWAGYGRPGVQTREEQELLMVAHDQTQHAWFMGFLDRLFGPALNQSDMASLRPS